MTPTTTYSDVLPPTEQQLRDRFPLAPLPILVSPDNAYPIYHSVSSTVELWGPDAAEYTITHCSRPMNRNRKNLISESRVRQYRIDMLEGRWDAAVAQIVYDTSGRLLNGHHTLTAQTRSRTWQVYTVVRGQHESTYKSYDKPMARKNSEVLAGTASARTQACAIGRKLNIYDSLGDESKSNYGASLKGNAITTPASNLAYTETFLADINLAAAAIVSRPCKLIQLMPSVASTCYVLFGRQNIAKTAEFFGKLLYGENLANGDPLLALRTRLLNQTRQKKLDERNQFALMFKAWIAYRDGLSIVAKTFYWSAEQHNFPTIE